jgi:hypothetical protein
MDHNAEIAAAAKAILAPLGCVRKGRSRIWLDDHGWWAGVIEFQPSGFSKGSYLNVAASYMWKPGIDQDVWTFDALIKNSKSWRAVKDASFSTQATELAVMARTALAELCENHRTIAVAADWLASKEISGSLWHEYNLGMAYGLAGSTERSRRYFKLAVDPLPKYEWIGALARESQDFAALLDDPVRFRAAVLQRIQETRSARKLRPLNHRETAASENGDYDGWGSQAAI